MSYFLLTLCAIAVLWQLSDLVRSKASRDVLSAIMFASGVGAMVLLYRDDVTVVLDGLLGADFTAVVRNLVLVAAFAAMQFFYIRNMVTFRPKTRHYVELSALSAACVAMITAALLVGPTAVLKASSENLHDPAVLTFFSAGSFYLIYACVTQIFWSVRDVSRIARRHAYSFLAAVIALALGCALYLVLVARRVFHYYVAIFVGPEHISLWPPPVGLILICLSVSFMVIGVMLPLATADTRRWIRWGGAALSDLQLRPLDAVVCSLYPRLLRPPAPEAREEVDISDPRSATSPETRPTARELRVNRCSDGYGRLHDIMAGYVRSDRVEVKAIIDILTKIPGGLPTICETGDTRQLIRISQWLKKNRATEMLARMSGTPRSSVTIAGVEKGEA